MRSIESVIASFTARGIRLIPDGNGLIVEPASKLTDADREDINAHGFALLAPMSAEAVREIAPDSRHPLIADAVRAKIETIEAQAGAAGWPAEILWNAGFWDMPRGLAAVLDAEDEIGEVTPEYIEIWK